MTVICSGPCQQWAHLADIKGGPCLAHATGPDAALMDDFLNIASDILYQLSGQQFKNICREVIRPCQGRHGCGCDGVGSSLAFGAGFGTYLGTSGAFREFLFDSQLQSCGCPPLQQISLGVTPITGINQVLVDGITLRPSTDPNPQYQVDEWKYLVRLPEPDGTNPGWPCCSHLELPATQPGTFQVDFNYGHPVPVSGVYACTTLACEFFLALTADEDSDVQCRLPRNIISITRQGVSVLAHQAVGLFQRTNGRPIQTGLWEVDSFLSAYNPYGVATQSIVLTPDVPPAGRRINT